MENICICSAFIDGHFSFLFQHLLLKMTMKGRLKYKNIMDKKPVRT